MELHAPGAEFPLDLAASAIRVSTSHVQDGAYFPFENGFPLSTPLQVFRETATGFEAAPFALEQGANLVSHARALRLLDPQPGRYQLAWDGDTCRAQASPAGTGKDIGGFTLTPSVPLPAAMGTLTATPSTMRSRDFQEGVSGDCSPVMVHVDEAEVVFTLAPSAELLPWVDAVTTGLEIDGQIAIGFSKPDPVALAEGRLSIRIARICASDTPRYLEHAGVAEGHHVGKMRARIEGLADVASAEVEFDIRCDVRSGSSAPFGDDHPSPSSSSGGCAVSRPAAGAPGACAFAVATLGIAAAVARRRRRVQPGTSAPSVGSTA